MRARFLIISAIAVGCVVTAAAAVMAAVLGEPMSNLTRDVAAVARISPLTGVVSVFNGMVWAAAASLTLFVAYLGTVHRRWVLTFGALLLVFAADDSLQLHESAGPHVGIPEAAFFAVYALIGLALLPDVLRRRLPTGAAVAFLVGGFFLAASIGIDVLVEAAAAVEDSAKLIGALVWLTVPILLAAPQRPGGSAPEAAGGATVHLHLRPGRKVPQQRVSFSR